MIGLEMLRATRLHVYFTAAQSARGCSACHPFAFESICTQGVRVRGFGFEFGFEFGCVRVRWVRVRWVRVRCVRAVSRAVQAMHTRAATFGKWQRMCALHPHPCHTLRTTPTQRLDRDEAVSAPLPPHRTGLVARVRVAGACGARACDVQDDAPAPAVMNMKETHVAHPRTPMRMSILK